MSESKSKLTERRSFVFEQGPFRLRLSAKAGSSTVCVKLSFPGESGIDVEERVFRLTEEYANGLSFALSVLADLTREET